MLVDITPAQVTYLKFLVAHRLEKEDREFLSQRQAFARFGRGNVERWLQTGKIESYLRPKCIEYKLADLLSCAEERQDYDK